MIPKLKDLKQTFNSQKLKNIEKSIDQEFDKSFEVVGVGLNIAVAVGSRGIENLPLIVKSVCDNLVKRGHFPFIVPAMGSHGGATASGQIEVLESLGITEAFLKVKIRSSMDVVELDSSELPCSLFIDKISFESDGIVLINRIKPHTDFNSDIESGLVKIAVVGLGKHLGALEIHSHGVNGLKTIMPEAFKKIVQTKKIIFGLAIVENGYDETMIVKGVKGEEVLSKEKELLSVAKKNMPSLPIRDIDILIVDKMGKNISGTGLDPNIIGRLKIKGESDFEYPRIKYIIVDDITSESHGNAVGVGFADVITKKLFKKIDFDATYANIITSTFLERGKIPLVADNIDKAFEIVHRSLGPVALKDLRVVHIKDTLHLSEIKVSKKVLEEFKENNR